MRYAIWYHFYNLKNAKNTHGGVLFLVKLQRFLNCKNGTRSRKATHVEECERSLTFLSQKNTIHRCM